MRIRKPPRGQRTGRVATGKPLTKQASFAERNKEVLAAFQKISRGEAASQASVIEREGGRAFVRTADSEAPITVNGKTHKLTKAGRLHANVTCVDCGRIRGELNPVKVDLDGEPRHETCAEARYLNEVEPWPTLEDHGMTADDLGHELRRLLGHGETLHWIIVDARDQSLPGMVSEARYHLRRGDEEFWLTMPLHKLSECADGAVATVRAILASPAI